MALKSNTGSNRYSYARGAVIIVFVLIGLLSFLPIIKYGIAFTKMYSSQSAITIGLSLRDIDANDMAALDIDTWQEQYLARHKVPLSLISLDYIYVPKDLISEGDSLCISEVKIFSEFSLSTTEDVIYLVNENTDKNNDIKENKNTKQQRLCLVAGKNAIFPDHFRIAPIAYSRYIDPFFYPFDRRTINYSLSSQLYFKSSGNILDADTEVLVSVAPPRWIANTNVMYRPKEKSLNLITTIYRSPFIEILSIIVPLSVLFIVVMLPRIKNEVGSFWEVVVGLILGLWGLHEVLIPSYIDYPTVIEALILILYTAIGIFVITFGWRELSQRDVATVDSNRPIGDIPDNESLENLFVWALNKINSGIESTKVAVSSTHFIYQ